MPTRYLNCPCCDRLVRADRLRPGPVFARDQLCALGRGRGWSWGVREPATPKELAVVLKALRTALEAIQAALGQPATPPATPAKPAG